MKTVFKRISAAVLTLAVTAAAVVFDVPGRLIPKAEAAGNCSGDHRSMTAWGDTGNLPTSGNYYLTEDVSLNKEITLEGDLTLCLNGHTITQTIVNKSIIAVKNSNKFTLFDCRNSGKLTGVKAEGEGDYWRSPVYIDGGTFDMYGGSITENTARKGGGVFISSGEFNLHGGSISNNEVRHCAQDDKAQGGGVYMRGGTFNMSGGEIAYNTASREGSIDWYNFSGDGGGIYMTVDSNCLFNISGGMIKNNNAGASGGGIYLDKGTVKMTGGTITGNTAKYEYYVEGVMAGGGGDGGGVNIHNNCTFIMSAGTISNNYCDDGLGGGIYNSYGTCKISGGTISGNDANNGGGIETCGSLEMTGGEIINNKAKYGGGLYNYSSYEVALGGNVKISGNTSKLDGSPNNVYLEYISKNNVKENRKITIMDDFNPVSPIGISSTVFPTDCSVDPAILSEAVSDRNVLEKLKSEYSDTTLSLVYDEADGVIKVEKPHSFKTTYSKDKNKHWYDCSNSSCTAKDGEENHTWNNPTVTQTATCTTTGKQTKSCSKCSYTITETIPATGHVLVATAAKAATCTENGNKAYWTCSKCKKIFSNATGTTETTIDKMIIDKKEHTPVTDPAVAATCTTDGKTEGSHCSVCNQVLTAQTTISKTGHIWDAGTVTKQPTCTERGIRKHTCVNCGEKKDAQIEKAAHKYSTEWTSDGTQHWHVCTVCKTAKSDTAKHVWDSGVVENNADCSNKGSKKYTCTVCQVTKNEEIATNDNHDWGVWTMTKAPTKTDKGQKQRTCSRNSAHIDTAEIPVLTDSFWTLKSKTDATCTAEGLEIYKSTEFGEVEVTLPKAAHTSVIDDAVAPTCTDTGLKEGSHCSVCNEVILEQEVVDALGHDFATWEVITEPTCTDKGVKKYTCSRCDAPKNVDIDANGHTEKIIPAVAATCTETGLTEGKKCSVCQAVLVKQEVTQALGHDWGEGEVTKQPTCTETGAKAFKCSRCNSTRIEEIPANGHTEVINSAVAATCTSTGLTEGKTCSVCSVVTVKQEVVEMLPHAWGEGTVTTEPTEETAGVKTFTCSACGATKTETIAPLAHTHNKDTKWSHDAANHWHACLKNCGEKVDAAAHAWNSGTVTKQPTRSAAGEKILECTVCGVTKTVSIPATGGSTRPSRPSRPSRPHKTNTSDTSGTSDTSNTSSTSNTSESSEPDNTSKTDDGNISKEVQPGKNAPAAKLETPLNKLVEAVFDRNEQETINDGSKIKIILTVDDAEKTTPAADKSKVETTIRRLSGYKHGQYLDVNLLWVTERSLKKITETNAPITVTFEIPIGLRGNARVYSVIRVHEGETTILKDLDNDPNTVTVETDKFSTYALVYNENDDKTGSEVSASTPSEGETATDSGNSSADSSNTSADSSNTSADSSNTSADSSNTSADSSNTSSDSGNSSAVSNNTSADSSNTSSTDRNNSNPSGESSSVDDKNPPTGIAITFIPIVISSAVLAVLKRKKK